MALKAEVDVFAFTEVKTKQTSTLLTKTQIQVPGLILFTNFAKQEDRVVIYARTSLQVE
jgi:hypothetical protein